MDFVVESFATDMSQFLDCKVKAEWHNNRIYLDIKPEGKTNTLTLLRQFQQSAEEGAFAQFVIYQTTLQTGKILQIKAWYGPK